MTIEGAGRLRAAMPSGPFDASLGFVDGVIGQSPVTDKAGLLFSQRRVDREQVNRLQAPSVPVQPLYERLNRLKENSDACA